MKSLVADPAEEAKNLLTYAHLLPHITLSHTDTHTLQK